MCLVDIFSSKQSNLLTNKATFNIKLRLRVYNSEFMKLRLLFIAILLTTFHIDSFAQFEKNSFHATAILSDYFKYGGRLSYFPAKNLELGIGSSFNPLSADYKIFGTNYVHKTKRWAINYRMNYYISNWIIKPKIVGSLAFMKNEMGFDTYSFLPFKYSSFNAALGVGLSIRLNKRIRIEGDITYNKFTFKADKGASPYIWEAINPKTFISEVSLSYQIAKFK